MAHQIWPQWFMTTSLYYVIVLLTLMARRVILCKFCLHYISHKPHILLTSCFPHCLHITVTAMLHECTNVQALENTTAEFMPPVATPDNPHAQTISDALKRDPISIARNAINTIRSS